MYREALAMLQYVFADSQNQFKRLWLRGSGADPIEMASREIFELGEGGNLLKFATKRSPSRHTF
jgi:hypothetical protein